MSQAENDTSLTGHDLDKLREGYQPKVMAEASRQALCKAYPPGAPYVNAVVDGYAFFPGVVPSR